MYMALKLPYFNPSLSGHTWVLASTLLGKNKDFRENKHVFSPLGWEFIKYKMLSFPVTACQP